MEMEKKRNVRFFRLMVMKRKKRRGERRGEVLGVLYLPYLELISVQCVGNGATNGGCSA
jgi:hypothetical protein